MIMDIVTILQDQLGARRVENIGTDTLTCIHTFNQRFYFIIRYIHLFNKRLYIPFGLEYFTSSTTHLSLTFVHIFLTNDTVKEIL